MCQVEDIYDLVYFTFASAFAFCIPIYPSQREYSKLATDYHSSPVLLLFEVQYRQVFPLLGPNMEFPQNYPGLKPRMNTIQMKVNKHNDFITVISWVLGMAYIL